MNPLVAHLWLIPVLPMAAAGIIALLPRSKRLPAAGLAIGSLAVSLVLSIAAFAHTLSLPAAQRLEFVNVPWLQFGDKWLRIGWLLDPLTAVMLVMVTFVGLLIFIYSTGYMAEDENFTRFFCFLALFAGAMLAVLIANSLLLLFMAWEIVGLTSYLLIGFWYHNPAAAAAAKKAFLVTRIGDLGLLIGMVWLYAQAGTLLFYDNGLGSIESGPLSHLPAHTAFFGLSAASPIAILIFCGAAGKSGQVPLHVWLPDAMEGPTPVSALIHAATMVAAGVFLMARIYPLMSSTPEASALAAAVTPTAALQLVTWIGAITALFAATIAVAQFDIKRILAYSTVSQLGYMMMGLGVGGPAVGMFHLITHAFFKALLFLGAGSVIHGCSGEQDIRRMGGLRKYMPVTFAAYTAAMLALCGFPLFAGFWSKDGILDAAHAWSPSVIPFWLGTIGALLTAFYMARQMAYVFFGTLRPAAPHHPSHHPAETEQPIAYEDVAEHEPHTHRPHESPAVMTVPLVILATFAVLLGFLGTPAWPWFQAFLNRTDLVAPGFSAFAEPAFLTVMLTSTAVVLIGLFLGWWLYSRNPITHADAPDILDSAAPAAFTFLGHAWYINELYAATLVRLNSTFAVLADILDRFVFGGVVQLVTWASLAVAQFDRLFDTYAINGGFDLGTHTVRLGGWFTTRFQTGRVQTYLRFIAFALIALVLYLLWGATA
ncbi:MAG TPA: NADH-quinone oxidoreductase subunit L [Acidobacteriaceae bacterium]|nr:NADH-quinone oxidoreductase subunit L [Acidobacteriaceae bacterium]